MRGQPDGLALLDRLAFGAEGRVLGVEAGLLDHRRLLGLDVRGDRAAELWLADPVGAVRERRRQAALQFVLPLGARLEQRAAAGDGALDELVVAELEVEHLVVVEAAPVAAIKMGAALE